VAGLLTVLAARAAAQPPPPGSGPYSYVRTRGWSVATARMTDGRLLDARTEETDRELWLAADGSGRIEETRGGQRSRTSRVYGPGELSAEPSPDATAPGEPEVTMPGSAIESVRQLQSVWLTQAVRPELQARLLHHLAAHPGLNVEEVTDRAGRAGIAVSAEEAVGRTVLVLDTDTGMLLAAEEVAPRAGGVPVRAPVTMESTLWLRVGFTSDTDARP